MIKPTQKDKNLVVRVDSNVHAKLERLAAAWSTTLSGAVRRAILEAKMPKVEE